MFKGQPASHKDLLIFEEVCSLYRHSYSFRSACLESNKTTDSCIDTNSSKLKNVSIKSLLFAASLSFTINHAYGLSAMTVNVINGSEPYLLLTDGVTKLTNLNELLGFKMPKRDGSSGTEQIDANMNGTTITVPEGMKYRDVVALIAADGNLHNLTGALVGDDDGDADIASNTSISGQMKATWYNNGKVVSKSDLGQELTACEGPYTLKIEVPTAVFAKTKYGFPYITSYGTHSGVTYTFLPAKKRICYIQPYSMFVWTNTSSSMMKFPHGYNPAVWEGNSNDVLTQKGFKRNSGFPTTGFYKAKFSLIGPGNDQSKYRCSSSANGGKITLSSDSPNNYTNHYPVGTNCTVTYNSSTKRQFIQGGMPKISMEYNTGYGWIPIDSYQIPIPNKWAIGKGKMSFGDAWYIHSASVFPALDACRGLRQGTTSRQEAWGQTALNRSSFRQKYLYRREEISNAFGVSSTIYPEGSAANISRSLFSRDVDGTFQGEWGNMTDYTGSGWAVFDGSLRYYWTAEAYDNDSMFYVEASGYVSHSSPNYASPAVMCRDD